MQKNNSKTSMKIKTLAKFLFATALSCNVSVAFAKGVAFETGMKDVAFQLRDLTPDDGIDARYNVMYVAVSKAQIYEHGHIMENMTENTLNLRTFDYQVTKAGTSLSFQMNETPGDMWLSGTVEEFSPGKINSTYASGVQIFQVSIAANSEVTFSASVFQSLGYLGDTGGDYQAYSSFTIAQENLTTGQERQLYTYSGTLENNAGEVHEEDVKVILSNNRNYAQMIYLYVRASTDATVVTSPVPEPSTYAMLVVGLIGLGVAARRQRRRA